MDDVSGAPSGTGSREPEPQAVPALTGFDPSRFDGPSFFWIPAVVAATLAHQEQENANRPDFTPAISREMAERAINALYDIYACRSSDTAAVYAWLSLWRILGLDWSRLPFLERDSDGSPKGGDSATGSVHDGAGLKGIAQESDHAH